MRSQSGIVSEKSFLLNMELNFQIILQKPPADVAFGLQKGSGNNFETVQIQRSGSGDLFFNRPIGIKGDPQKDKLPDFRGPFVQGPIMGRFIYIRIGVLAGREGGWNRRLKIPLTGITWGITNQLNGKPAAVLEPMFREPRRTVRPPVPR